MVRPRLKTRRVLRFTIMLIMLVVALLACIALTLGGLYWVIGLSLLILSLAILLFLAAIRQLSDAAIERKAGEVLYVRPQNIESEEELEINTDTIKQMVELYITTKLRRHEESPILNSERLH